MILTQFFRDKNFTPQLKLKYKDVLYDLVYFQLSHEVSWTLQDFGSEKVFNLPHSLLLSEAFELVMHPISDVFLQNLLTGIV